MITAHWITQLTHALRTYAMLKLLALGFAPADVLAMAGPSVAARPASLPFLENPSYGYEQAA